MEEEEEEEEEEEKQKQKKTFNLVFFLCFSSSFFTPW
jgi:hypothetical protein